jgi:hypothetical protein
MTMRLLKRILLWSGVTLVALIAIAATLIIWPDPLFAYSAGTGKIIVRSDQPIPAAGGEKFLHDCEALLARSPLKAESAHYHVYVTNADWRHYLYFLPDLKAGGLAYAGDAFLSGANFVTGRHIKWSYVTTPPRTLAYFCAHEVTHLVVTEHLGLAAALKLPVWVREGLPDYVAIDRRQSFDQLNAALGDREVDVPMMMAYGGYPRFRLLVTYFLEKKGWSVDARLHTKLNYDDATALMRTDTKS